MNLKWIKPVGYFGRTKWKLLDSEMIGGFIVPKGFITDGLSLPFFVRWLLSPTGRGFRAAVLHDCLLKQHVSGGVMTRQEAAHQFRRQLKLDEVNVVIAQVYYLGVRVWDRVVEAKEK